MCRPAILIAAVVDENLSGFGDVVVTVVRERPERCVARGPRVPVDCWCERAGLYPQGPRPVGAQNAGPIEAVSRMARAWTPAA